MSCLDAGDKGRGWGRCPSGQPHRAQPHQLCQGSPGTWQTYLPSRQLLSGATVLCFRYPGIRGTPGTLQMRQTHLRPGSQGSSHVFRGKAHLALSHSRLLTPQARRQQPQQPRPSHQQALWATKHLPSAGRAHISSLVPHHSFYK